MRLEVLVSIGIAIEGLQFIIMGWILLEVYAFKGKLTSICARLTFLERQHPNPS